MENQLKIKIFSLLILFSFGLNSYGTIWVKNDDEFYVKHLELSLKDLNSSLDTTTYPISLELLKNVSRNSFNEFGKLTNYLTNFKSYSNPYNQEISFFISTDNNAVRFIDDNRKSKSSFAYSIKFKTKTFAGKLKISREEDFLLNKKFFLDGSHLSFTTVNTIFGIGIFDRWWGPTHDNNLILSNYARPSPGVFLTSLKGLEFKNFFNILGKINYSFFINRLESDRHVSKANLLGGRLTFIPINSLTFGVTRTLMFGGGGRPNDLNTLWKAIIGQDNVNAASGEIDPSNQQAGWDLKYDFNLGDKLLSTYIQNIGEDGDFGRYFISKEIVTMGLELKYLEQNLLRSYGIEFSNTIGDYGLIYNVNYEHYLYQSGYRYRKLPIGAFIDNDSQFLNLKITREINKNLRYSTNFFYGKLNRDRSDGGSEFTLGGSSWGTNNSKFVGLKNKVSYSFTDKLSLEANLILNDKNLYLLNKKLDKNSFNFYLQYIF